MKATNLNDSANSPVSFGGAQARYVKITASPEAGNGTWGDSYYALSEIRFTEFEEEEKPDKTALEELYGECKDLTQDNYTDDSWNAFEAARNTAKAVLDNEEATQEEVNKALEALTEARNNLAEKEPEPADTSVLEAAVESAERLNEEDYTEETFAPFKEALKNAKAVLADENATQEEVDAAVTALTDAQNNLVKKEPSQPEPVDKSVLEAAIARAESLNAEDYTEESWSALEEAKEQAKRVLEDENATQEDVNAAVQALNDAQSSLEEKPEEPVKPPVISNIVDKVIKATKKFFCAIAEAVKNWFEWLK